MLKRSIVFVFGIMLGTALFNELSAESIDGTSSVVYKNYNHVFRDSDQAKGFVYFADGFTVLPDAAITMDCVTSVSGAIDLRGTGVVHLARDLALDSHVTFSDGGYFSSKGMSVLLGGDTSIPEGKAIHCVGDMVIDGGGRTLFLEPRAQFFLESNSTLTLRNMKIVSDMPSGWLAMFNVSDQGGCLAFDHVEIQSSGDVGMRGGNIFFHQDVTFSGGGSFSILDQGRGFIAPYSSLCIEKNTSLYLDRSQDAADALVLQDQSSTLRVDEGTLNIEQAGLHVSDGTTTLAGDAHIAFVEKNITETSPENMGIANGRLVAVSKKKSLLCEYLWSWSICVSV